MSGKGVRGIHSAENPKQIIARGRRVLALERDALGAAHDRLDDQFALAVRFLRDSKGRVIVAGVGKSGLIGRKIAATLTSTGTPASFLHPADSVHGDLGIVGADDVAILNTGRVAFAGVVHEARDNEALITQHLGVF